MTDSKTFNYKGVQYTLPFPNVGQYRNIESMKQALSNGMYSSMVSSRTITSLNSLDMIDMEATLSVLCPKLVEALNCPTFSELGILDFKELKELYDTEVLPWWNEVLEAINPKK